MGILFSKLNCNCKHPDKICKSKKHVCICLELIKCRYGIKKFNRCIEKSRICFDDNREEIKCLAKHHKKNGQLYLYEDEL
jgi:hypothetical protein